MTGADWHSGRSDTRWVVFSGPPCAGKTAALELLQSNGFTIQWEASRLLTASAVLSERGPIIKGNQLEFERRIAQYQTAVEEALSVSERILLDRALPDSAAYLRYLGAPSVQLERACHRLRYAAVFFFAAVDYEQDPLRTETEAAAIAIGKSIRSYYYELGYNLIEVPRFSMDRTESLEQRRRFLLAELDKIN